MNTSEHVEIPFIRANISIAKSHPFGAIIYDKKHSFHLKVSEAVYQIIALINGINSVETIQNIYNKKYNTSISHEKVKSIIYNLLGNRVIQGDQHEPIKSNPIQHIMLQRLLIDTQKIKQLIQGLEFFYSQRGILIFLTLSTCTFYLNMNTSSVHNQTYILLQLLLISATTLIHELGHITACKKYNIKSKGIGIGLYLGILPVAYADVSGIWLLKKKERIIVNLSGIYLELIFLCTLYIISQLTGTENLKSLSLLLIFKCFFNLLPLYKSDGYWILCDYFNLYNLHTNAKTALKELVFKGKFILKNIALSTYLLFNACCIFMVIYYLIKNKI